MLSDEEKREYEELKSLLYTGTISQYGKRKLIDIIEKQSKEIEELKKKNIKAGDILAKRLTMCNKLQCEIEELKDSNNKLYSILQENKKQTQYSLENIDKKWEDKIKAKIEELDKEEKEKLKGTKGQDRYAIKQEYMYKRSVLQSLLEKE